LRSANHSRKICPCSVGGRRQPEGYAGVRWGQEVAGEAALQREVQRCACARQRAGVAPRARAGTWYAECRAVPRRVACVVVGGVGRAWRRNPRSQAQFFQYQAALLWLRKVRVTPCGGVRASMRVTCAVCHEKVEKKAEIGGGCIRASFFRAYTRATYVIRRRLMP